MGYQVGNTCYLDRQQAENVYFSLVAPVIQTTTAPPTTVPRPYPYPGTATIPGKTQTTLIAPQYQNGKWTLNGQTIQAHLPQCDPAENLKLGMEVGWAVLLIMASVYFVMLIKRIMR